ncbi:MAG TPA: substrate-binding domain-containing protein [Candidatus Thermoplasmatota archaeon]|nr:substrate-binding domain-containing protein [Candidatus Thermoplasmatota archaeon]
MRLLSVWVAAVSLAACLGDGAILTIGSTSTTQDSGILDALLPAFEKGTGVRARAAVGGTGQIIEAARRGDVDVLFTHSPAREHALVDEGWAVTRQPVMFNRFVIAGPASDPAHVASAENAPDAFGRIHDNRSTFVSRGDTSGTHDKELGVWRSAGLDPASFDPGWYKETGAGQGQTLTTAAEFGAYLLVDEATLRQSHEHGRGTDLGILFSNDDALHNQYAVTQLNAARLPRGIDVERADRFADWITGMDGQAAIASFKVGDIPAFTPNADPAGA